MSNEWLVPGARAWWNIGTELVAVEIVSESEALEDVWLVREQGSGVIAVPGRYLSPRPAEPATEPVPLRDAMRRMVEASMPDECQLCGVPLADESDVENGYVSAFARDPSDVTRCLSHGRTNLGVGRG